MVKASFHLYLFALHCCAALALSSEPPCQLNSPSATLQFVATVGVAGCRLTLYFPADKTSTDAYLSPAFCFTQSVESLLRICPKTDSMLALSFLAIPLTVTDTAMLAEAQTSLGPLLRGRRPLAFLQPIRITETAGLQLPLTLMKSASRETAYLRLLCKMPGCHDLYLQFENGMASEVLEKARLTVALRIPGSVPLTVGIRATVANLSSDLSPDTSPAILPAPFCANLIRHQTLKLDSACSHIILKRTSHPGNFVVQPELCYRGNYSGEIQFSSGLVTFTLEASTDRSRAIVTEALSPKAPASITFMSVFSVEVRWTKTVNRLKFENLRLSPDGSAVEVRARCNNLESCATLRTLTNRTAELWRHVWFSVEFHLLTDSVCKWTSEMLAVPIEETRIARHPTNASLLTSAFHSANGSSLCIRPQFVKQIFMYLLSAEFCAARCLNAPNCQAFRIESGSCQLFVFDKCSKHVRDCNCTRRGQVFVKQQPGLQPGALCPSGYGDDLCGVKYGAYSRYGDWRESKRMCESDAGLVIMADIADATEMRHAVSLCGRLLIKSVWLGGYRSGYSSNPAEGLRWIGCGSPIDRSLWLPGEPNNRGGQEPTVQLGIEPNLGLSDVSLSDPTVEGVLCKCVSPFD